MNELDGVIIGLIFISAIVAYYKGFLYTMFQTLSTAVALYLSYRWYKPIKGILRGTFLNTWLQKLALSNVEGLQNAMGLNEQTQLINHLRLPIPNMIKENLIHHNNPEIYKLLGVENFKDYVGVYIANFYLSIIAFVILLGVIKAVIYIGGESIQIVAKLPIIRCADRWIGLGIGFIKGVIGIWIGTILLAFLIALPKCQTLSVLLGESVLGKWFYENNLILQIIDQLFV